MRILLALVLFLGMATVAQAQVRVQVYVAPPTYLVQPNSGYYLPLPVISRPVVPDYYLAPPPIRVYAPRVYVSVPRVRPRVYISRYRFLP